MELQVYWEAIQENVCPRCLDGDGKGNCRLPVDQECMLKSFLPQIVMTISNVKSDSMDAYIAALRRHVCILCDHQTSDLKCKKREDLECALDRYFPVLVEIIETVRTEMRHTETGAQPT